MRVALAALCSVSCLPAPSAAAPNFSNYDRNGDGKVSLEEAGYKTDIFQRVDANHDGFISPQEMAAHAADPRQNMPTMRPALPPTNSLGFKPLCDMASNDWYKGRNGGLYGDGRNTPPPAQLAAALALAKQIQPLDAGGNPSSNGAIVLIGFGMSNTAQEFQRLEMLASRDAQKSPRVVVLNVAQGGQEARAWAQSDRPWLELNRILAANNISTAQVQAVWVKLACAGPVRDGEFPKHTDIFKELTIKALQELRRRLPNLRIAYLSSRIYAGYAVTALNPEPYAYEYGFAVRDLILAQIKGMPELNCDPARGALKAPLLLWGPYLWADGVTPRKTDGMVWTQADLGPDGTHPSTTGTDKVAGMLLTFLKTDPTAAPWFLKPGEKPKDANRQK